MKKGIVMEVHQDFIIIMTKEGAFEKGVALVRLPEIGEEVDYRPLTAKQRTSHFNLNKMSSPIKLLPMVCIILLLTLPFYLIPGINKTFAYVTIDINPSIELEIDANYHVQKIRPLNKDAKIIVDQLENVEEEEIETIIATIINESEQTGLINEERNILLGVSFVSEDAEHSISENLQQFSNKHAAEWNIATFIVPKNIRDEALANNISMNKAMSETMNESDVDEELIDEKEKMIINSFYHNETKEEKPKLIESPAETEQVHIEEKTPSTDKEIHVENKEPKVKASGNKVKEEKGKPNPNSASKHNANHNSHKHNNKVKEHKAKDEPNAKRNHSNLEQQEKKVKEEKKKNQPIDHEAVKEQKDKQNKKNQDNNANKKTQKIKKNKENSHHHNDQNNKNEK